MPFGQEYLQVTIIRQITPQSATCCTKHYIDGQPTTQPILP